MRENSMFALPSKMSPYCEVATNMTHTHPLLSSCNWTPEKTRLLGDFFEVCAVFCAGSQV